MVRVQCRKGRNVQVCSFRAEDGNDGREVTEDLARRIMVREGLVECSIGHLEYPLRIREKVHCFCS